MPLKYKLKSRDEIPAEHAALYVERDGAFFLDAEGATDKAKADEMRNNNIELRKQIEDFTKRFEGIDPEQVRQLAEEKRNLELQAQGHKPEEIDKLVTERLKTLKADWDKQFATVTDERDALTTRLTAIQIDQGGEWCAASLRGGRQDRSLRARRHYANDFGGVGRCPGGRRSASI